MHPLFRNRELDQSTESCCWEKRWLQLQTCPGCEETGGGLRRTIGICLAREIRK